MEGALKEIGKLAGKIGYRTRVLLLGVLLPGFVILCEVGLIWAVEDSERPARIVRWTEKTFQSQTVAAILAVLLVLAASYVLGYVARESAFWLSTSWLRRGWRPTRQVSQILQQLRLVHGATQVDSVIGRHEVFRLVRHESDFARQGLPRPPDFYVREYCKLWLRMMVPALSTEYMEAEINLVIGLIVPVVLAVIPCLVFLPGLIGPVATAVAVVAILLVAFRIFYNINGVRCQETEEAVLNFLFAHWTGLADQVRQARQAELKGAPRSAVRDSNAAEDEKDTAAGDGAAD